MTTLVAQNFDSFVFAQNDEIKTTSLLVAEKFGKLHKDVLRKIQSLECSKEFHERNFAPTVVERENPSGGQPIKSPAFEMTKDGFMFLVMGFTGKAAAEIKEAYINAFNFMLAKLKPVPNALRDLPPQTLTPAMKKHINQRVNYLVKHQVGASYASLGKLIQDTFNVNKRELIPASKYREVCALLDCEPDPKALQGELVEPAKLEYQPPKGMVLIAESELATLQERRKTEWSGDGYASMILGINDNSRLVINPMGDVTTIMRLTENDFVGTFETIVRELKLRGFHVVKDCPENKLETIVKIAQLSA